MKQKAEKFVCQKCGACCKNLIKQGKKGFLLFEWEAQKLSEHAENKGINIKIKAVKAVFDKSNKQNLVLFWQLDHETCPFLEKNRCSIYEDRPLVCKRFPLENSGLFKFYRPNKEVYVGLSDCTQKAWIKSAVSTVGVVHSKKDITKHLNRLMPEQFKASIEFELVDMWMAEQVKQMELEGYIVLGLLEQLKVIGIFKFMIKCGFMKQEEADRRIWNALNLADAQAQIDVEVGKLNKEDLSFQ